MVFSRRDPLIALCIGGIAIVECYLTLDALKSRVWPDGGASEVPAERVIAAAQDVFVEAAPAGMPPETLRAVAEAVAAKIEFLLRRVHALRRVAGESVASDH